MLAIELALACSREVVEGIVELGLVECDAHTEEKLIRFRHAQAQSSVAASGGGAS